MDRSGVAVFEQVEQQGCGAATLLVGTLPDRAEVQHVGDGMVVDSDDREVTSGRQSRATERPDRTGRDVLGVSADRRGASSTARSWLIPLTVFLSLHRFFIHAMITGAVNG